MGIIQCPECSGSISDRAMSCPHCGYPILGGIAAIGGGRRFRRGFEWKSKTELFGFPLIHVAVGHNLETGRPFVAKGIIAIGQFAVGLITIAQIGIGFIFGFGQIICSFIAIAQCAFGVYFGLGQIATGMTAIGQLAVGSYVLAQMGWGAHVWSKKLHDPVAISYFRELWQHVRTFL